MDSQFGSKREPLLRRIERALAVSLAQYDPANQSPEAVASVVAKDVVGLVAEARGGDSAFRSAASYLRQIRRMLEAIRAGTSRNQFLAEVFSDLEPSEGSDRVILVLEGYPDPAGSAIGALSVPFSSGRQAHRLQAFRDGISRLEKAPFTTGLLVEKRSYDFYLSSILGANEYGSALEMFHGDREAWICALPLAASEQGEPERCLIAVYPIDGVGARSTVPPGAEQEWDILKLVPDIFMLLQYRVRNMKEQVEAEQRRLIADLAPSAITHELGTNLSLMESALTRTTEHFRAIQDEMGGVSGDLLELARELNLVRNRIDHAKKTTDAFTNLERRNAFSTVDLSSLVEEISTILKQRMNRAKSQLVIDIPSDLAIVTDARYVEHVITNVVLNALEAVEPKKNTGEQALTIAIQARISGDNIEIVIANDGPSIPVTIVARVFEKGVTTKPFGVGHGQGLYLCRQIAQHLGGNFGFGRPPSSLPNATVTFVLSIPRVALHEADA